MASRSRDSGSSCAVAAPAHPDVAGRAPARHVALLLASRAGPFGRRRDPVAVRGLTDTQPLREFLTRCVDVRGIGANIANRRLRAAALSATSYTTGRSVTFVQGTADTPVWERVQRIAVRTQLMHDIGRAHV